MGQGLSRSMRLPAPSVIFVSCPCSVPCGMRHGMHLPHCASSGGGPIDRIGPASRSQSDSSKYLCGWAVLTEGVVSGKAE